MLALLTFHPRCVATSLIAFTVAAPVAASSSSASHTARHAPPMEGRLMPLRSSRPFSILRPAFEWRGGGVVAVGAASRTVGANTGCEGATDEVTGRGKIGH